MYQKRKGLRNRNFKVSQKVEFNHCNQSRKDLKNFSFIQCYNPNDFAMHQQQKTYLKHISYCLQYFEVQG